MSVASRIEEHLSRICVDEDVAIPLAVESGSRAWGFPSPDSDYDCRFIFVRPVDQHLSPWLRRDVIETPPDAVLDINGWDLAKAVKLLLKGNAVVLEWLRSPIVYRDDEWLRSALLALAERHTSPTLIGRHYLHLGERQFRALASDSDAVPQKRILYAARPAAALRWLRLHPGAVVPPMHLPTLMAECDLPADVSDCLSGVLARKAISRELGLAPLPGVIGRFLQAEFETARAIFERVAEVRPDEARPAADALYRQAISRFAPCIQSFEPPST